MKSALSAENSKVGWLGERVAETWRPEDGPIALPPDYSAPPVFYSSRARSLRWRAYELGQVFDVYEYIATLEQRQLNVLARRDARRRFS